MKIKIQDFLDRLKRSTDTRVLASNFKYMVILKFAGYFFPLLTLPYLARVIGVEGLGKIAFASAIILWLHTITDWGFSYTSTRNAAQHKDDVESLSTIFSVTIFSQLLLATLSFLILILGITFIPYLNENSGILLVTFLTILGQIIYPQWFFQAIEKMKFITYFGILSKILFTLCVFLLIKEESDYILSPLLVAAGYFINGILSIYLIVFRWKISLKIPKLNQIFTSINESKDVFLNNLLPNFYDSVSVALLGFWSGSNANGIYDAGRKMILVIQSLTDVLIQATFPFLSRKIYHHSLFAKVYLSLTLAASALSFVISPYVIAILFTKEFSSAVVVMRILSFSIFFRALNSVYGVNYLIILGYTRPLRNITLLSAVFGLVISIPLIYFYSYIGVALTLVISQAFLGVLVMKKALNTKAINKKT